MSAGFLDTMAAASEARLAQALEREPLEAIRRRAAATRSPPPLALSPEGFDLIAEVKLRSPSAGDLATGLDDIAGRALAYARGGAAAVSVLTEPSRFGGELTHLSRAAEALAAHGVPAMRKDFLVDPYQIYEARAAGAGGVLIIIRMLDDDTLHSLLDAAEESGLFVLLEAFDAADLRRADGLHASVPLLLGLNSRDLQTLAVDSARLESCRADFPAGSIAVAESGLNDVDDASRVARLDYRLALVGSALMRAGDPEAGVAAFIAAGRSACVS